jgi:cell division protein FtsA
MQSNQKYKLSIDIGSTKIAGIAYKKERNGSIRIISKHILHSEGFKAGKIINMQDAENSIINMIYALENDSKTHFLSAEISISGSGIKSYYVNHKIKIDSYVTQDNINNLIAITEKKFNKPEYEVIHSFPIEFTVDNNIVEDPNNIFCNELACKLHIVVAERQNLLNIANCLSKCNIKITRFICSPYAAGLSCLSEDAKEMGSIIFDLGAYSTSFGVFLNKQLIYTSTIPLGSYYITSDISKALGVNLALAEKIKIMYGKVKPGNLVNQFINFQKLLQNSRDEIDLTMTIGELSQIITPRLDEIIEMIKNKYDQLDISHIISKNIYITGGGANLDGVDSAFREYFKYQVNRIKPRLPNEKQSSNYDLQESVLIGMMICEDDVHKSIGKSFVQKIVNWVKNNI